MNVLARLKTPECGSGMITFRQNYFAGFFVTIVDFIAVIESLNRHFVLQAVKKGKDQLISFL
jgi:hypothetical protein